MNQLTKQWITLLAPFAPCFRAEVYTMFTLLIGAWLVCLGKRSISRLWETTGQASRRDHSAAFRFFSEACWNWDEVCRLLLLELLAHLVPGTTLWLVVDDTLCHKRGAKVAFGGMFLDAVLSSKKHKCFRFGHNWVTLGLVVQLPFRRDRFVCLNVLWRLYQKKDAGSAQSHRSKSQLARQMVDQVALWLPDCTVYVVGDCAYVGKHLLKDLPGNVAVLGPLHWQADLTRPLPAGYQGRRKKGDPLPNPSAMKTDPRWPWHEVHLLHPKGDKRLQVKVIREVCWYPSAGSQGMQVVLVHDTEGHWRDEALLCTDERLSAAEVIVGYMRRWSVEVAYAEAKGQLGFHDPGVWCVTSVERAAPMAWLVGTLVVLWYARWGHQEEQVRRERPWYTGKVDPTFADMLSTCRYQLWREWWDAESEVPGTAEARWEWLLRYVATATT